ncbi:MAG: HAD-IB family hydrolase [Bacteroidales bacterium]|nr:HAD-IB family hydrolase [Bacteroidales bacterium]
MKQRYKYIAFYDLDHTIFVVNSATNLVEEARRRGIMSEKQYRHALYLSIIYKLGLGEPAKIINRMLSWLKGLSEESVKQLCREVFNHSLVETIRKEILEAMEQHSANNAANVLLSSASSPICEPVSEHLNLDDVICTRLKTDNSVLTGTTDGKLVYGMEKKHRMLAYCQDHGYNPEDAYYYGDSITDVHVMKAVGHPVAVSPDKKLLKIANKLTWYVIA